MSTSVSFEDWTAGRAVAHYGTNAGHVRLPFQTWRKVKEAFTPEIVARAVRESPNPVDRCVDPFAGSGTTALACQFLDIRSTSIEVNPYLADLARSKLAEYDVADLQVDLTAVVLRSLDVDDCDWARWSMLPSTFIEPGRDKRWLFDLEVARSVGKLLDAIDGLERRVHRRFFRIILSGILLDVSNVVVNGKGRRYRRNWAERSRSSTAIPAFKQAAERAIEEIRVLGKRRAVYSEVLLGTASGLLPSVGEIDLAVFSPPYPNSFDYTDIYNVELWMLGYLQSMEDNRRLRLSTLPSHVQLYRKFDPPPSGSPMLDLILDQLRSSSTLWSPWIPDMVGAYFAGLTQVMRALHKLLATDGCEIWMVVGDSKYGGVIVETASVLKELAPDAGFAVRFSESSRSLRSSAQQGGEPSLPETLLVLSRS